MFNLTKFPSLENLNLGNISGGKFEIAGAMKLGLSFLGLLTGFLTALLAGAVSSFCTKSEKLKSGFLDFSRDAKEEDEDVSGLGRASIRLMGRPFKEEGSGEGNGSVLWVIGSGSELGRLCLRVLGLGLQRSGFGGLGTRGGVEET